MKWDARLYDNQNSYRTSVGIRLMNMAGVKRTDRVLDIGCGTGTLTSELALRADMGIVVGIDPSAEMLAMAREKAASHTNISLLQLKAEEIAFGQSFDLAYSSNALQWARDQREAVGNIAAALRPGGRVAIQLPADNFSPALARCIRDAYLRVRPKATSGWALPWHLPTRDGYASLLRSAGIADMDIRQEAFAMTFQSANDALTWALSAALVPFMAGLNKDERARFKYAVAMNFETCRGEDGIVFNFNRVIALGRKGRA